MKTMIIAVISFLLGAVLGYAIFFTPQPEIQIWLTRCEVNGKEVIVPYASKNQGTIEQEKDLCNTFAENNK